MTGNKYRKFFKCPTVLIDDLHTDWSTGEWIKPERLDDDAWKQLIETTHRAAEIAGGPSGRAMSLRKMGTAASTHSRSTDLLRALPEPRPPPGRRSHLGVGSACVLAGVRLCAPSFYGAAGRLDKKGAFASKGSGVDSLRGRTPSNTVGRRVMVCRVVH